MTKAKTNALDALRALIAERQQYEQWMATLESKRAGTPEQVFERVQADYQSRLQRVIGDIRGYSEELQLSISTLSSRLVEVAREEDTRREGLQEAELRAAVGEYEPEQWEQLRSDAERDLEKTAADRASLDGQLAELRAIQKLSEAGSTGSPDAVPAASTGSSWQDTLGSASTAGATTAPATGDAPMGGEKLPAAAGHRAGTAAALREPAPAAPPEAESRSAAPPKAPQERSSFEPVAAAASAAATPTRPRGKTPPGGTSSMKSKSEPARPDQSKTLKCPECGTPNYPTEWYCERCGGELATM